jgi:hypothetical protein
MDLMDSRKLMDSSKSSVLRCSLGQPASVGLLNIGIFGNAKPYCFGVFAVLM